LIFSDEQLAMIDQGLGEFDRGEDMASEEALEFARLQSKSVS
jgi:hypothetical protein